MCPFPNEVFIEPKEKARLVDLLTEADAILDKYPYSSDASYHTVTTMSRAKSNVSEAKDWIELLHTTEESK